MPDTEQIYYSALLDIGQGNNQAALQKLEYVYSLCDEFGEKSLLAIILIFSRSDSEYKGINFLEQACERYPENANWPAKIASIWMNQGEYEKAIFWIDKALAIDPDNETFYLDRVCWLASRCEDPVEAKVLYESWGDRFMNPLSALCRTLSVRDLARNRRLKIGYISGDFKNHSVRYFIEPFLKNHHREFFEVHAFMTMPSDQVTDFLKKYLDFWHDVKNFSDESLLEHIRKQNIDILVDLSGHTRGSRLKVFAMRAAPVQVTWFGYMQTLGMKAMDWRLTDWGISPQGTEKQYTENLYRLNCMAAYEPPLNCEELFASPYHRNGFVTMVSLNHVRKISDHALSVWRDILLENPKAGLVLISSYKDLDSAQSSLAPRLAAAGMPMERVLVSNRLTMVEFMRLATVADFALDSFPISGGTTTLHSLWMGLPILTLEDSQHGGLSSSTAATMKGLGLNECVATGLRQYKAIASSWIRNPTQIDHLRARCRPALQASPLMDHTARVSEVENAFRFMWNAYVDTATSALDSGINSHD